VNPCWKAFREPLHFCFKPHDLLGRRGYKRGKLSLELTMAEIIAFKDLKRIAERCEVLTYFEPRRTTKSRTRPGDKSAVFPSSRPFISGNLTDLFEQANAVAMRHHHGDPKVPDAVAEKCLELIQALEDHAQPE
jgi:hypothetical protein